MKRESFEVRNSEEVSLTAVGSQGRHESEDDTAPELELEAEIKERDLNEDETNVERENGRGRVFWILVCIGSHFAWGLYPVVARYLQVHRRLDGLTVLAASNLFALILLKSYQTIEMFISGDESIIKGINIKTRT